MPTMMKAVCGPAATSAGSPAMPAGPSTDSSTIATAGDTVASRRARSPALAVRASGSIPGSVLRRLQRAVRMASWRAATKTETETEWSVSVARCAAMSTSIDQRGALLIRV
jgi:hypothetical protein